MISSGCTAWALDAANAAISTIDIAISFRT
jgi:hypothetical protein